MEYYSICERVLAPEEAACKLIESAPINVNQWLNCIMGNVRGFADHSTGLTLHSQNSVGLIMDNLKTNDQIDSEEPKIHNF